MKKPVLPLRPVTEVRTGKYVRRHPEPELDGVRFLDSS